MCRVGEGIKYDSGLWLSPWVDGGAISGDGEGSSEGRCGFVTQRALNSLKDGVPHPTSKLSGQVWLLQLLLPSHFSGGY